LRDFVSDKKIKIGLRVYAVSSLGRIGDVSVLPTLYRYKEELEREHVDLTRSRVDVAQTAVNMGVWAVKAAAVIGASIVISNFIGNRTPPWVGNTLRNNPVVRTQIGTKLGEAVGIDEGQLVAERQSLLPYVHEAISAIEAAQRLEGSRAPDDEHSELDTQDEVSHEAWPKVTIIKQDPVGEIEGKSADSAHAAGTG
jgi:hypothetical protein